MKDKIHPKTKLTSFTCATCGSTYQIQSTSKTDVVSIDVCSKCHPFFAGKMADTTAKGRAEKLSNKFNVTKPVKKEAKKTKTSKKSNITDLDQLKA